MKVALFTLGCRVNQSESAAIEGTLRQSGVEIVGLDKEPDFCVINTCTVTQKSDADSRQLIRRAARAGAKVIVTGCYSQLRPEKISEIPGVFGIIENSEKDRIPLIINKNASSYALDYSSISRPYIKIQDGCNYRCSYCSVPLARGNSRSVPLREVIKRVQSIEAKEYKEVVLTGVHLGTYGRDLPDSTSLAAAIRTILSETGIHRIRLSSIEVNELDDEMLEIISDRRICRHLHIPLQSGSDIILKRMRRSYSQAKYEATLNKVFKNIDNLAIGTDVIVGFPGEGDSEFNETFSFTERLPFSYMHIFPFSPRPDTVAATMEGRPSSTETKKRLDRLKALNSAKRRSYLERQIGRDLEIVVEELSGDGKITGTSSNYVKVRLNSDGRKKGSLLTARAKTLSGSSINAIAVE